jgi:hypothetical protein
LRGWCRHCLQISLLPHKNKDAKLDPVRDHKTSFPTTLSRTISKTMTDVILCHVQTMNSTGTPTFQGL